MYDLKMFGRNKRELDALIELVRLFSRDIGMEYGLEKFAVLEIVKTEEWSESQD